MYLCSVQSYSSCSKVYNLAYTFRHVCVSDNHPVVGLVFTLVFNFDQMPTYRKMEEKSLKPLFSFATCIHRTVVVVSGDIVCLNICNGQWFFAEP